MFSILCALTMLFLLCSCKDDNTHKANEFDSMKTAVTKGSVKDFITLLDDVEPSGLISGYKIDEENCYNVTPLEVAAETDMKIFKFCDSCASFLTVDNEIYPLCESFGGYGFVNAVPCDFDNDGNKDLLVASSWGSGMHRSIVSVFNSVSKESTVLYDTSTTDTPDVDLAVARSTAKHLTGDPKIDKTLFYSVLSIKINADTPAFIPYQK